MKMNKIAAGLGLAIVMATGSAMAADTTAATDNTQVYFHGTITNAPCSLDPDSVNQTVEMGDIASHMLENKGISTPKEFHFILNDCDISTQKTVSVTFGGTKDVSDSTLLNLGSYGEAGGAGVGIRDSAGQDVTLDTASDAMQLSNGSNTLTFAAYLKGDGASAVTPGEFKAISDVTFTYQ